MGPTPISHEHLQRVLEQEPEQIQWSVPRVVIVHKGESGKLGLKLNTYKGRVESFTIITKVKEDCCICRGILNIFDRIISINDHSITREAGNSVLRLLHGLQRVSDIILAVSYPDCILDKITQVYNPELVQRNEKTRHQSTLELINRLVPNTIEYCATSSLGSVSRDSSTSSVTQNISLTLLSCDISEKTALVKHNAKNILQNETAFTQSENSENKYSNQTEVDIFCKELHVENKYRYSNQTEVEDIFCKELHVENKRESRASNVDRRCSSETNEENKKTSESNVENRLSNESTITLLLNNSEGQNGSRNIKRGHSQVSGSSSNQSVNSDLPLLIKDGMRKANKGDKSVWPLFTPGSTNSPDRGELEPLKVSDSLSPLPQGRSDNFTRTPSLPISGKDAAVSMQDIMFEYQGLVQSHAGDLSQCQCASCVGTAESRVCYSCGTKPGTSPKKTTSPGVSLFIESQEPLPEDYGHFILKNPHMAVWDGRNTHVVEIDKGQAKEFGFSYKVKVGKNQDTSVEVYTLVKSVDKGGPAMGKLRLGDWIRSVNGTPIQNPKETFSLISSSSDNSTLRLLIQRPVGFSQHPSNVRSDKSETYMQVAKPPSPLPSSQSAKEQDPLIPGIIEPRNDRETVVRQQNTYFSDMSPSSNETDPGNAPFPKTVKFPKVRIFVCGSEAENCTDLLLKDSAIEAVFQNIGYTRVEFSMATNCFGNVVISKVCSNLFAASSQLNSYSSHVSQSDLRGGRDIRCIQCGSDFSTHGSSNAVGAIVNVELFVVPDDKLFHYCCSYLFTKSSLFILTFDGDKMLRAAPQEFSRLHNLSHTIRSYAGEECHIMSCGLLESGDEANNVLDEVRALFYTPYNTQLQDYNVSGPELINIQSSESSQLDSGIVHRSHELQFLLWKTMTDTIQRQHVLQPALVLVDYLHSMRNKDQILTEDKFMSVIKSNLPDFQLDVHQMILTYLNTFGEIILGKATPLFSQGLYAIESLVILNPTFLLDCLYRVLSVICEDKQVWSRTHYTGFIKASDLTNLTGLCNNELQCRYVIDFWQCIGLIFRKPKSTNVAEAEFFLPYFSQVPSSSDMPLAGKKDQELYLQFSDHESSQTFYQVLFVLAEHSDSPDSLVIHGSNTGVFTHNGCLVTVFHQKIEDRVKFMFRKEDKGSEMKPSALYKWLYSTCNLYLEVNYTVCALCPLGETCHRGPAGGAHMINLRESKPQFCGDDRIDLLKPIRVWKQKDGENLAVENVSLQKLNSKPGKQLLMELPWTIFHGLCVKLKVPSTLGNDWKGLAGLMGYNAEQVELYKTAPDPVRQLLCDWGQSNNSTVEQLITLLSKMERVDIVSDIQQSLVQSSTTPTATTSTSRNSDDVSELQPSPIQHSAPAVQASSQSSQSDMPTKGIPPISNITVSESGTENAESENETVPSHVPKGRGVANIGIEEAVGPSASLGGKLSNLDNNNQVDSVRGIDTDMMITPVETPRRAGPITES